MPYSRLAASVIGSKETRPAALAVTLLLLVGCSGSLPGEADWPPLGKKWFDRAEASFRQGDMEDARLAIDNALRVVPDREQARVLSAGVALAELEYDRALSALRGLETSEARSVRGRAHWYAGEVDRAADELEKLLSDPEVRDPWAAEISRLARIGTGRKPFEISGGLLAVTEMPRTGTSALIVPLEINGEPALGLIATGTAEAVIDSSAGARPAWVSLRFAERVQVRDVPALAKDLSGISRQVNAPIKILLGINVLRHLRPTFDFAGGQFIVRTFEPPPPPLATSVRLSYARGGGMLLRGAFGAEPSSSPCLFLVDTGVAFPLTLSDKAWDKAGVQQSSLTPVPGAADLRQGTLPLLRIGAFSLPGMPGLSGDAAIQQRAEGLGVDLDGLMGSGLLASFRVTLVDGGRSMWLEDLPRETMPSSTALQPIPDLPDDTVEEGATELEPGPAKPAPAKPAPNTQPAPSKPAPNTLPAPTSKPAQSPQATPSTRPAPAKGTAP